MVSNTNIRVLIVDDSLVFCEALARGISYDSTIEVLPSACDPYEAWHRIQQYAPDVVTCDMEMPGMNGIDFITKVMQTAPLPIIAVSSREDLAERALRAGAIAFLSKPRLPTKQGVQNFILELIGIIHSTMRPHRQILDKRNTHVGKYNIIAIGASTGGTEALHTLLSSLPSTLPGIVIVQHIPPVFSTMFAERLNQTSAIQVREARNGDFIEAGTALVAPGDYHLAIVKLGHRYKVECFKGNKVNGHAPSVDILFESVAKAAGNHAVGIQLTGMGVDGAKGLLAMRRSGARTIGQDEHSSVVYGMPKAAYDMGAVEIQVSLDKMKHTLLGLIK